MPRKRTKKLTLVLLGSLGAAVSVAGCGRETDVQRMVAKADQATARRAAAAGASASICDGTALTAGAIAACPVGSIAAPLNVANLASILDQADETLDVIAEETGVARPTNTQTTRRTNYRYHGGPGIGWFVWGYALARMSGSPSYVPPRTYGAAPRPIVPPRTAKNPTYGGSGGGTGFGRSAPIGGGSGSVSRGGFGSSGAAHASGGS